jgi:hypothetical protein
MNTYNDINTPIEITENSTGLDMLNEARRRFSVHFNEEVRKILSVPAVETKQAKILSRHLSQRLMAMKTLTILTQYEINHATRIVAQFSNGTMDVTPIVFDSVKKSSYEQYSAEDMKFMWNVLLQELFSQCLKSGASNRNYAEKDRLFSFANNAIECWNDMQFMEPEEYEKAQSIIKDFYAETPNVSTKYSIYAIEEEDEE